MDDVGRNNAPSIRRPSTGREFRSTDWEKSGATSEYGDVWLKRAREIPRAPPPSTQQPARIRVATYYILQRTIS